MTVKLKLMFSPPARLFSGWLRFTLMIVAMVVVVVVVVVVAVIVKFQVSDVLLDVLLIYAVTFHQYSPGLRFVTLKLLFELFCMFPAL